MTNTFEDIEKMHFEHEIEAQQELKKIDIVALKMTEKYGDYEALRDFVTYLASMEKVFARSRIYDSSPTMIKDEIIKTETHLFSLDNIIDEDVFVSIRDDFNLVYLTITQVYEIAERLFQKFSDKEDCVDFITSLRDVSIAFIEGHEKKLAISEIQDKIYHAKMEVLSSDGDPDIAMLENIYAEFRNELSILHI